MLWIEKRWNYSSTKRQKKKHKKKRKKSQPNGSDHVCWLLQHCVCNCEGDRCLAKQTHIMKSYMRTMGEIIIIFPLFFVVLGVHELHTHVSFWRDKAMPMNGPLCECGKKDEKKKESMNKTEQQYDVYDEYSLIFTKWHKQQNKRTIKLA